MSRERRKVQFIENQKLRVSTFNKRKDGLISKARELSILCGIKACMIINGPKGINVSSNQELDCVWSSDSDSTLQDLIKKYKEESMEESGRKKRVFTVKDYYIDKKRKAESELANLRKKNLESKFPTWHPKLKDLKEDELRNLSSYLEDKLKSLKARRDLIKNTRTHTVIGSSTTSYGPSSPSKFHQQQNLHTNSYPNAMKTTRMPMNSFENSNNSKHLPTDMMEPNVMNPITSFESNSNYNSHNWMTMAMNSFENSSNYNPRFVDMMESNITNQVSSFGNKNNYHSQNGIRNPMNSYGNNTYYPRNRMAMPTDSCDIQPIAMIKPGTNQMVQPMFHPNTTNTMETQFCYNQMPFGNYSTAQKDANVFSSSSLMNRGKVTNQVSSSYDPNLFDYPELNSSPMQQSYACGSEFDNRVVTHSVYDPSSPYFPLLLEYSAHPEVLFHRQSSQQLDFHHNF